MIWEAWRRTIPGQEEYEAWDVTQTWYVLVEKRGPIWRWHVAHVADGYDEILYERDSWALTRERAQRQSKSAAEKAWRKSGC